MQILNDELEAEKVVDREKYISELFKFINETGGVSIINAGTAVGKSSIVTKFISKLSKSEYKAIRIRNYTSNNDASIAEGYFFNRIVEQFHKKFNDTPNLSFSFFFNKSKEKKRWIYQHLSSTIFKAEDKFQVVTMGLSFLAAYVLHINEITFEDILDKTDSTSQSIKYAYCKFILEHAPCKMIICIDNVQNIDNNSLLSLVNLISVGKKRKHSFVLEYTTDDSNRENYERLCHRIKDSVDTVYSMTVEKLDKDNVLNAVINSVEQPVTSCQELNRRIYDHYQKENTGNIRELIDFFLLCQNSIEKVETGISPTLVSIETLTKSSLIFLACIINFRREVPKAAMKTILVGTEHGKAIKECERELQSKGLITINEKYKLKHASIIDCWNDGLQKNREIIEANEYACLILEPYFNSIVQSKTSTPEVAVSTALIALLNIYLKGDALKMSVLLEEMRTNLFNTLSVSQIVCYCNAFFSAIETKLVEYKDICFEIIQIVFSIEQYETCLNYIKKLEGNIKDDRIVLYKVMLFSALDLHKDNIIFYEKNIEKYKSNPYVFYNLKLIVLSSYRSLNRIQECLKIDKALIDDKNFKNRREYGYFLRLSEMYLNRDKSIKNLKKSCSFFRKRKMTVQYGKSLISYAFVSAVLGHLHHASRIIQEAEKQLEGCSVGAHMFKVNKAAIRLYQGKFGAETWELLEDAERTAVVTFDKLAIIVNKLVWCYENKDYTYLSILESQGISLVNQEPDHHIHALFYYDMYLIYSNLNNDTKAREYYDLSSREASACKPVYARLNNQPTTETKFALKYKWHVCFLAYWTYDILKNDESE